MVRNNQIQKQTGTRLFCASLLFLSMIFVSSMAGFSQEVEDWYEFHPANTPAPGAIGMQDWLEKPAGKHGRITRRNDQLIYNEKPIKLWGLNLTYSSCSPDKQLAEKRAAFYAKYGINSVRLHKYADGTGWAGIQSPESFLEFDPEALDRMDYLIAQFKKHGIYTKLSSTFGVKLGPADKKYVPYMDEFGEMRGSRVNSGHGSIFLSRELQDMQIQQIVKILHHKNPYTGVEYAKEPAVAVVELFNEDSALWFGVLSQLQNKPTLRKRAEEMFSDWLKEKYGSQEGLEKAWGKEAIDSFANEGFKDEHLDRRNIAPAGNPWFYDPAQLNGSQSVKKKRLLDTMLFLYEMQNQFYDRYVQAIRGAGYDGEILGSNWQAGRAMSHYYNLHSDSRVGLIDRHNYFGGGRKGSFNNSTMLAAPGSGTLSAGMQQVGNRPFMLSEWIHVFPNEWGVEGPAIIGAYAMGLQGWDASYMFQNRDGGGFSEKLGSQQWDVTAPQVLGVFPAVSRQVLRGDVEESDIIAKRYVHVPSLHEGKLGFEDQVKQQYDVKTFDSDKVSAQTLAVARSDVEFTEEYRETPAFDLAPFRQDGFYVSSTNQLRWKEGSSKLDGFFTINTDAEKAVVGFADNELCKLGTVEILPQCRYGAIYVTAQGQDETLASTRSVLITAIARARNTNMKFNKEENELLSEGGGPILMEPVKASITIRKEGSPTVFLLNHDGLKTERTLPIQDGVVEIDGARDKTPYYLIQYN
ncbi:MAG: beta-galactosidase [Candidatus Omnitrophica bacterium]|nr:beta-galactosidase [Candidatus Omnitrophota bacterium]